jgi:hypothetical protein
MSCDDIEELYSNHLNHTCRTCQKALVLRPPSRALPPSAGAHDALSTLQLPAMSRAAVLLAICALAMLARTQGSQLLELLARATRRCSLSQSGRRLRAREEPAPPRCPQAP